MNQETKIQTLSLIAGTQACDASCPFCVSKMTPDHLLGTRPILINHAQFFQACRQAIQGQVDTMMITGKGEPTLFPNMISWYLSHYQIHCQDYQYQTPRVELQTNGLRIFSHPQTFEPLLNTWQESGLKLIAISVVSFDPRINHPIYTPHLPQYPDLNELVTRIHTHKLDVRLATIMIDGGIDTPEKVAQMIDFAKKIGVQELTLRPVNSPTSSQNPSVTNWVQNNHIQPETLHAIQNYLEKVGSLQKTTPYGARIYLVDGQNVCLTNSLTESKADEPLRQLIFYPSGEIATSWNF